MPRVVYNRRMRLRFFACALLGLLLTVPAGLAYAAPPALTVVTGSGTALTDETTARYDFGTRRMSDESPLGHTFTLRNDSAAPITVDRLQSSCGCTTAFLADNHDLPLTIGPGGIVSVQVSVAPHRLSPGPIEKSVWVFTHGAADASLLLEITGTLQDDTDPTAPETAIPPSTPPAALAPQAGKLAPAFTLADAHGKSFSLTSVQGHPVALFFFCGCPWCAEVAHAWGKIQHDRHLPKSTQTLIVFAGSPADALNFAAKNGLDRKQTTLLPDPDSALTENVYKLTSCPRAFALGRDGVIHYTNDHPDDQPRVVPAKTIVSRTLTALAHAEENDHRDEK